MDLLRMALVFILVMAPSINFASATTTTTTTGTRTEQQATDGSDTSINNSAINKR